MSPRFEERQIAVTCMSYLGDPFKDLQRVADYDEEAVVREAAAWGLALVRRVQRAT
jgi:hypothetical protein